MPVKEPYLFVTAGLSTSTFDTGIRNVGFVHSPLMNVPDNTERKSLMHVSDWMPTFMHIATGVSVDGSALGIDGVDQFSTITSGTPARSVSDQVRIRTIENIFRT